MATLGFLKILILMVLFGLAFFGLLGRIALIIILCALAFNTDSFFNWLVLLFVGALGWQNNATTWFPSYKKLFSSDEGDQQ
ncbi:hypothetical protein EKO29_05910 [Colwellia sp. Arc7-635]|uniref:hypothetical protein n=1 Tax=Colwellia sp. Arc7-635 TaxID=2497879 RepID=UPI000F84F5B3|nr:hypothetical protein [Colwellia sp. Arc7-635]AZQ83610.1 hypothetical protein EKO29_05910 [Colwellia sp. Arc7-635]